MEADKYTRLLKKKICCRTAAVAVIGLGYVGLPMAVEQARHGFRVAGVDSDSQKVELIKKGQSYICDVPEDVLRPLVERGMLRVNCTYKDVGSADVIVICVPTPLKSMRQPDLSFVASAVGEIAGRIKPGCLICLESTTFPGTTREVILPLLESTGLEVGRDFFLAFSPERIDPGNKQILPSEISKVVGGVTPRCLELACDFYAQSFKHVVPVSSPAVAEMTKIFENTYRSVNIALVNEFMILCDRMGLDIWEVVDAAATKPFGIHTFYPGPGVGGHCIPVDPVYLAWKAMDYDYRIRFIDLAGEINNQVPEYVVHKLMTLLNRHGKCLHGARILVLGVTYKKDIDDIRESPALKIISALLDYRADVVYSDPSVPQLRLPGREDRHLRGVSLVANEVSEADCVLIVTDHSSVDYQWVVDHARLILDTRNATKNISRGKEKVTKL